MYVYYYNKMLPLSPGEFMLPFLLTFTLIFVIHKHELLNLILLLKRTPFDICPLCDDDVRDSKQVAAVFVPKIHDPTVALIILFCCRTRTRFLPSEVIIFNNIGVLIIFEHWIDLSPIHAIRLNSVHAYYIFCLKKIKFSYCET